MSDADGRLIELAISRGWLFREQAMAARAACDPAVPLEVMLVSLGYLTASQADELVQEAQAEPEEEPVQMFGPCSVLEPLGRGPSGPVYRAFHGTLGLEVALKVAPANPLNKPFLDRFEARARKAVGATHAALATVHEVGRQEGAVWMARDLLPGEPLTVALAGTPLDPGSAIFILRQAAWALTVLHGAGAVHGNLKLENVFLTGGRDVKLTDAGFARDGAEFLKGDADLAGSIVHSMPPEQWTGEAKAASDLYACGVLWYTMLTGAFPFAHRWTKEIRKNHLEGLSKPPSEVRPDLPKGVDVIFAALAHKESRGRYAGIDALLEDLDRLERGDEPQGAKRAFIARPTKTRRRGR